MDSIFKESSNFGLDPNKFKKVHAIDEELEAILTRQKSKLKVIGITGTNGKTTAVHLTTHILEGAGFKVASISSLKFKIGGKEWKNKLKMTMPGRLKMQKFLRKAVNAKCDYVVMEVTSEGIKQNRHKFINFKTAVPRIWLFQTRVKFFVIAKKTGKRDPLVELINNTFLNRIWVEFQLLVVDDNSARQISVNSGPLNFSGNFFQYLRHGVF